MSKEKQNIQTDKSPSFYKHYPRLFAKYFKDVSGKKIDVL